MRVMGFEEANLVLAKVTHLVSHEVGMQTQVSLIPMPMLLTFGLLWGGKYSDTDVEATLI